LTKLQTVKLNLVMMHKQEIFVDRLISNDKFITTNFITGEQEEITVFGFREINPNSKYANFTKFINKIFKMFN